MFFFSCNSLKHTSLPGDMLTLFSNTIVQVNLEKGSLSVLAPTHNNLAGQQKSSKLPTD